MPKSALVIGWNGVGKSAVIQNLCGRPSQPLPTLGVVCDTATLTIQKEQLECALGMIDMEQHGERFKQIESQLKQYGKRFIQRAKWQAQLAQHGERMVQYAGRFGQIEAQLAVFGDSFKHDAAQMAKYDERFDNFNQQYGDDFKQIEARFAFSCERVQDVGQQYGAKFKQLEAQNGTFGDPFKQNDAHERFENIGQTYGEDVEQIDARLALASDSGMLGSSRATSSSISRRRWRTLRADLDAARECDERFEQHMRY